MLELADLTVNRMTAPLGIGGEHLVFGWKLTSDVPDTMQKGYRLVARDPDSGNAAPLWDSGDTESSQSVAIPWRGPALSSRQRVLWTVEVIDNHGRAAQGEGEFELGLLLTRDWQAQFIETAAEQDPTQRHPAVLFRHQFRLDRKPLRARLYATAHGVYEARVNGAAVSPALLAPGFTVYDRRLQVQTYDVTSMVREGDNALGVIVCDGWYRGGHGSHHKTNSYGTQAALLAQLEVTYEDGGREIIATSPQWRCGSGAIRFCDFHRGVVIDAALHVQGWDRPGFPDAGWQPARAATHDFGRLLAQEGPLSSVQEMIPAIAVLGAPDGSVVLDFGQNLVGHVRFSVAGRAGHEIRMLPVETLDARGNPYDGTTVMPEFDRKKPRIPRHRWVFRLSGAQSDEFDARFTLAGFRYLVVENWPGELKVADVIACVVHSEMRSLGRFECSDGRINRLQSNVNWSLRGNFAEIPTDCPGREKAGWTGDIYGFAPTATLIRDVSGVVRRWLKDVAADQDKRGHGIVTCVSPNTKTYVEGIPWADGSAAWGDAIVAVPWALYQACGDASVLAESYLPMQKWIAFCERRASKFGRAAWLAPQRLLNPRHWLRNRYLMTSGFQYGDWMRPGVSLVRGMLRGFTVPPVFESTAIFAYSLDLMARIATVLGRAEDAMRCRELHAKVVKAFRDEFVLSDGRLSIDEQYAHVLALAFDLLPEPARQPAADRLAALVAQNGGLLRTGFMTTPHLMLQLTRYGHHAVAEVLMMQDRRPSWLYQVARGATTVWETWDGVLEDGSILPASQNHFSLGAVSRWLYEQVGGLSAAEPGYRRIRVAPKPLRGLSHCRVEHETPYGLAASAWEIRGNDLLLDVSIPANTTAVVCLPDGKNHEIGSGGHRYVAPLPASMTV